MFNVKREKGGVALWAERVSPDGVVTAWTPHAEKAALLDSPLAGKVKGEYAGRPAAGKITFTPAAGYDTPAVPADAVDDLGDALKAATAEVARLRAKLADRQAEADARAKEHTDLRTKLDAADKRAADLAAENADLRAKLDAADKLLAAATDPADPKKKAGKAGN